MKKLILFILLCICATISEAQEADLTGTWIGTYMGTKYDETKDEMVNAPKKLYVRINRFGNDYRIRMKEVDVANPSDVLYFDKKYCVVKHEENCICFTYTDEISKNYMNNKVISMDQREIHYVLTYNSGIMHISPVKKVVIYYDKHGKETEREDITHLSAWFFKDVDLYKEENDW